MSMFDKFGGIAKDLLAAKQAYGGMDPQQYKKLREKVDAGVDIGSSVAGVVQQDSPFNAAGSALGQAGDKLVDTGNPYAMAAGAVLKFAGAMAESVEKIRGWAKELNDANLAFADFSASMANVAADQEMRDFERKMNQGENRAETAEKLSKALGDLNDTMAPFEDAWANFKGEIATVLVEACTAIINWLPKIGSKSDKPDDDMKGIVYGDAAYQERLEKQAQGRRPKRFRSGGDF
jgi:hypothetical protein